MIDVCAALPPILKRFLKWKMYNVKNFFDINSDEVTGFAYFILNFGSYRKSFFESIKNKMSTIGKS